MASSVRAPKQWCLTKSETANSFEIWKENLTYTLSLDNSFSEFLKPGVKWEKRTKGNATRGLTDDLLHLANRRTAEQRVAALELMLGQIANYCPIISRNTIVKNSTSLDSIWQAIRLHFGLQSTGAQFIDFSEIKLEIDEKPEDLYQRLMAFVEDTLLTSGGLVTHHGEAPTEDEEMSPTLENMIVLTWLRLINDKLPPLVKQRFCTDLRTRTLASIRPEISQALPSLLSELRTAEDVHVMRSAAESVRHSRSAADSVRNMRPKPQANGGQFTSKSRPVRVCPLCKQAGRRDFSHYLSSCRYLPEQDKKFMSQARSVMTCDDAVTDNFNDLSMQNSFDVAYDSHGQFSITSDSHDDNEASDHRRVQIRPSPHLNMFHEHQPVHITLDCGATSNLISSATASLINADVRKSSHVARQADGKSHLHVVGETKLTFTRDGLNFHFEGLVVSNLDVDILGGVPFMEYNDIQIRPAKQSIIFSDRSVYVYGDANKSHTSVRLTSVLRAPGQTTTIYPGEYLECKVAQSEPASHDKVVVLEPRFDSRLAQLRQGDTQWPATTVIQCVGQSIRIPNMTEEPIVLSKNDHFAQVREVTTAVVDRGENSQTLCYEVNVESRERIQPSGPKATNTPFPDYRSVRVDPDGQLPGDMQRKFVDLHKEFDSVFDPKNKCYNGHSGPFEAVVNMGPVKPPQRKGKLPLYARNRLDELQDKFDALEADGVFSRPEDLGITVEYLNPSFLVNKPGGGTRLVTAFAEVGQYCKPQPSLLPDVNSTLRQIANWKFLVITDLKNAFFQIPLSKDSLKYCGVATPYRGVRVYRRCAMGMPGSEVALEELMSRLLGDMLREGCVAKIADDVYVGGEDPSELVMNWRRFLQILADNNIGISAPKTIVAPKTAVILGWIWSQGRLSASPHRLATLSTCSPPTTVRGMRSYLGAYKVLGRVLPKCASLLAPLENAMSGLSSQDPYPWSDEVQESFSMAQKALSHAKGIHMPRPTDQIWIVTDASAKATGLGATMYVTRAGKLLLAGFFSAKLRQNQITWLPCELEALAIASATKHFSPYLIQSKHKACILTDSKPCVEAASKLCRGEFSSSPRVATFLATVSRYQASIRHLAGSSNLPSDFASRNAPPCNEERCQVCSFVQSLQEATILQASVQDVLAGSAGVPFASRHTWLELQNDCADLRRTRAHLLQGTRPSKRMTKIGDVKRYLRCATVAKDGLLVVGSQEPLQSAKERIIVPRQVLHGLTTAMHLQLDHPSAHQLKQVLERRFFALDLASVVTQTTEQCHQCVSLMKKPSSKQAQSTGDPPAAVGIQFAADILKRNTQTILVIRETVSSFTVTQIISDERSDTIKQAIISLLLEFIPLGGPKAVIRCDNAPGFAALVNDKALLSHRIELELGRVKNTNKNPVAEKAIEELELELLKQNPRGERCTQVSLAVATARLNSRIRGRGLSAREMWTQRDMFDNQQLPIDDLHLIESQHHLRSINHPYSETSKSPGAVTLAPTDVQPGDLVYLYSDGSKLKARDRYMVVHVDGPWCDVRKFAGAQLRKQSYRVKRSEC